MTFPSRGYVLATWIAALLLAARLGHTTPPGADLQAARELFVQAEKDEDADRWSDALDKLDRVSRVRLTAGVRYHLALCNEHLGRLVAALSGYTEAERQARAEGAQDVLRLVGKQLAALNPRIPRLAIRVVPSVDGTQVKVDGEPLDRDLLGAALPVDPGEHHVEAIAPGRAASPATVTLVEQDVVSLTVTLGEPAPRPASDDSSSKAAPLSNGPPPASAASPTPPARAPAQPVPASSNHRAGAWVAAALAVALGGGGVAAYLVAGRQLSNGIAQCAEMRTLSPSACDPQRSSVRAWDFAAGGAWLGAAGAATVAVVLLAQPQGGAAGASAQLLVSPRTVGVGGTF